jgi:hypothetical protein
MAGPLAVMEMAGVDEIAHLIVDFASSCCYFVAVEPKSVVCPAYHPESPTGSVYFSDGFPKNKHKKIIFFSLRSGSGISDPAYKNRELAFILLHLRRS